MDQKETVLCVLLTIGLPTTQVVVQEVIGEERVDAKTMRLFRSMTKGSLCFEE